MGSNILDCCGLNCPEPVIQCRNLLNVQHPQAITVFVDNAAANENVSRLLANNGYKVDSVKQGTVWHVNGEKNSDSILLAQKNEFLQKADSLSDAVRQTTVPSGTSVTFGTSQESKILVFITTETLGRGSDELGTKLMENFLATLPELGEDVWRVILLNGGVKLAVTPGKALESLQALQRSGVSVLVCGACLTFYNMLEAKAVGETTNMLDVVTSLALADKVIRP